MDKRATSDNLPVFILANPRSGSTLLRLMLTCHPELSIPPEGGFIIGLWEKYRSYDGEVERVDEFIKDLLSVRKMEFWEIDSSNLRDYIYEVKAKTYGDLVAAVYHWYAQTHGEKSRWGDKNNFYIRELDKLYELFPSAYYVHLVRDGRDVACSYREVRRVAHGKYAPVLPGSLADTASAWGRAVEHIESFFRCRSSARYISLRYEDLVDDPSATLRRLCEQLGIAYSEQMLNFAEENRRAQLEPREFDTWKRLNREELTNTRVARWKREFFAEDAILFHKIAGRQLTRYGYSDDSNVYESRNGWLQLWGVGMSVLTLARRLRGNGARWWSGARCWAARRRRG